ncbi:MAG: hypothetical protein AB8B50_04500 [Pirellulaceae bacterium]
MAKCDEGYLCEVCGEPVEKLSDSALYLQFVIGWIDSGLLQSRRECHLRCVPTLAQFVEHPEFEPVQIDGDFDRRRLDPVLAKQRQELVSGGYERLRTLQRKRKGLSIEDYPLAEAELTPVTDTVESSSGNGVEDFKR